MVRPVVDVVLVPLVLPLAAGPPVLDLVSLDFSLRSTSAAATAKGVRSTVDGCGSQYTARVTGGASAG